MMKLKIGVCIKYYHENYGGMLQSYAMTKFLEKKNYDYEKELFWQIHSIGYVLWFGVRHAVVRRVF